MLRILASPGASNLYDCTHRFHRKEIPANKPVEFFCYEWQIPLISEYFVKPLDLKDAVRRRVSTELAMQIVSEINKA